MRILDILLSEDQLQRVGIDPKGILCPIYMPRMGKFVVLAGANGAGKSRLLKMIDSILVLFESLGESDSVQTAIEKYSKYVVSEQEAIKRIESLSTSAPLKEDVLDILASHRANEKNFQGTLDNYKNNLATWNLLTLAKKYKAGKPVFFVPENAELHDVEGFTLAQIQSNAESCALASNGSTQKTASSYLLYILRRARNSQFAALNGKSTPDDVVAIESGNELMKLVSAMLGENSQLTIDRDDHIQLFGRGDFYTTLSHGQRVLLKLAIQLHAQKVVLSDALIILDEPENHLHPAALSQVIDVLLNEVTTGQVWIATHSVPLISRLVAKDPMSLWYMADGKISHAGRRPEMVLEGLIGNETEVSMLREFTDLPAKLASNRFAAECLLSPTTVGPKTGDKQQLQMVDALKRIADGKPLRVLDFGAGQGRLLASLREEDLLDRVDYFAFDLPGDSNGTRQDSCRINLF